MHRSLAISLVLLAGCAAPPPIAIESLSHCPSHITVELLPEPGAPFGDEAFFTLGPGVLDETQVRVEGRDLLIRWGTSETLALSSPFELRIGANQLRDLGPGQRGRFHAVLCADGSHTVSGAPGERR